VLGGAEHPRAPGAAPVLKMARSTPSQHPLLAPPSSISAIIRNSVAALASSSAWVNLGTGSKLSCRSRASGL